MALRDSLVAAQLLSQAQHAQLDQAAAAVERQRQPEIKRMQKLQQAEARQGHWLGHNTLLRRSLAASASLMGPLAARVWSARQKPLREGLADALTQRTNSISW
jgi:2-polyprenyl-6-methoxyphenol hydroxylase-like FAD-dependent oxidoreductase